MKEILVFVAAILISTGSMAQVDNVLWGGVSLTSRLDDKSTIQFKPFYRADDNFGRHLNSSLDISVRRQLGKGWYGQVLTRRWFIPDANDQQFIWLDLGYKSDFPGLVMNNSLRLHYAMNDNAGLSSDFLRYKISFAPKVDWKVRPTFAFEPWWQLNGVNKFERYRIEPGIKIIINDATNLQVILWRQNHIIPKFQQNLWLFVLGYNI